MILFDILILTGCLVKMLMVMTEVIAAAPQLQPQKLLPEEFWVVVWRRREPIAVGGLATGPGEVIALPTAGVVALGNLAGAGGAWLLDKIFSSHNTPEPTYTPPTNVQSTNNRDGKDFTPKGKKTVIDDNKAKNNGQTVCENCGVKTTKPEQSKKGQDPS